MRERDREREKQGERGTGRERERRRERGRGRKRGEREDFKIRYLAYGEGAGYSESLDSAWLTSRRMQTMEASRLSLYSASV